MTLDARETAGLDVWDKLKQKMGRVAAAPAGAPSPQTLPPWAQDAAGRMPQTQGGQYETGDPQVDRFLRERALKDMNKSDDPYADAYQDPAHFKRMMEGAYRAGQSGDAGALDTYPPDTPIGRLLRRSYADGERTRGGRR